MTASVEPRDSGTNRYREAERYAVSGATARLVIADFRSRSNALAIRAERIRSEGPSPALQSLCIRRYIRHGVSRRVARRALPAGSTRFAQPIRYFGRTRAWTTTVAERAALATGRRRSGSFHGGLFALRFAVDEQRACVECALGGGPMVDADAPPIIRVYRVAGRRGLRPDSGEPCGWRPV